MYSFSEVGGVLGRITEERVPAALDSLELSRQAERIVAAAPKLRGLEPGGAGRSFG
jgi:adenylate cyclase